MAEGRLRTRPRILGHVRFNGVGGFDANDPARMIGRVFDCEEPCVWRGQNKILFKTLLPSRAEPDRYMVVTRAAEVGRIRVGEPGWCSDDVWVISLSESRDNQEAMLLMPAHSWMQTELGRFVLETEARRPWVARLVLASA